MGFRFGQEKNKTKPKALASCADGNEKFPCLRTTLSPTDGEQYYQRETMNQKSILLLFTAVVLFNCSSMNKNINKGNVSQEEFYSKIDFTTQKTIMIIPVELNGVRKNFLFDTGADLTIIQRDKVSGKTFNGSGAAGKESQFGSEIIESLKIGDIDFINTYSGNKNMIYLNQQIPEFGGLIGESIISKANWLINYPSKTLEISNNNISDGSFNILKINKHNGSTFTFLKINGTEYKVKFDFGSSSSFTVPEKSKLAKELLQNLDFENRTRERYTISGGLQTITEKVGKIPKVQIGQMDFTNVETKINVSGQARIGIDFFKNCQIYIDNTNGNIGIKQVK